jgi:DNA-binding IclR family transcriptional regulator
VLQPLTRPSPPTDRVVGILETLAADPESPLTMTDLARRLDLSVATCHAIVTSLAASGYLTRSTSGKRYSLGPRLLALGLAAQRSVVPGDHVRDSLNDLSRLTGCLCSIRAQVEDEILVMDHLGTSSAPVHEHVGDRYPFAPPFGLSFVIWGGEGSAERWMSRAPVRPSAADTRRLSRLISSSRHRGYAVHKGLSGSRRRLHSALVAATEDDLRDEPLRGLVSHVLKAAWIGAYVLEDLDPGEPVSVSSISTPILAAPDDPTWIAEIHLNRSDMSLTEVEALGRQLATVGSYSGIAVAIPPGGKGREPCPR